MVKKTTDIDLLFETSWEVCNKIGGIYTVLSTKANTLCKLYKDNVVFIGPDVWSESNPSPYFEECSTSLDSWKERALLPEGVSVRLGRWNVPGRPLVILVKFESLYRLNDDLFGEMWKKYGVDSLHAYGDYGEAAAFSHAAAAVICSIVEFFGDKKKNVIAHFDEWTTGMGLLLVKSRCPQVATIFTTHATSIGRSICGNQKPLYDYLKGYNGDQMARELNMEAKHSLEKTAAHQADCFTTVSQITAIECEQLLERRPDIVTPNGFESGFVPAKTKMPAARKTARTLLINTASALTGINYDDKSTFVVVTSGRCEYRNKGLDMFLDSINRVRTLAPEKRVIAYIMVPAWVKEARHDLVERLSSSSSTATPLPNPVYTHSVNNPDSDAVLGSIHRLGFSNHPADNVTVIYVPCYLNAQDGIFNQTYYQILAGVDATVFPSYYEPWGYTPLESIAFGVPTITTTLSGFGQWILNDVENGFEKSGVNVVERTDHDYSGSVENIARSLMSLINSDKKQLAEISNSARETAAKASWTYFIDYYIKAFDKAIASRNRRVKSKKH
ncbi:MAG: glycogen/starch synthase [Muribaculaceae bacterium]|nr:glycogen/starch synthase [Muribaculaceae bacterium]